MSRSLLVVPVQPDPGTARHWASDELAHQEYLAEQPSLIERLLNWIEDQLSQVKLPHGPGAGLGVGIVVVLLAALIGYAIYRAGGLGRQSRLGGTTAMFGTTVLSAAEHREASIKAHAAGDLRTSVLERFRAVVREGEERAAILTVPGRTAHEAATAVAEWFARLAGDLEQAATLFDEARYTDRDVTEGVLNQLITLDNLILKARPVDRHGSGSNLGSPDAAVGLTGSAAPR